MSKPRQQRQQYSSVDTQSPKRRLWRKVTGFVSATSLLTGTLVAGVFGIGVIAAPPAHAADPLRCNDGDVYVQVGSSIREFNVNTNTLGATVATGQRNNGLGVSDGGRYIYTIENSTNSQTNRIRVYDTQTETTTSHNAPSGWGTNAAPNSMLRGAVNPVTGIYYYASGLSSDGNGRVWIGGFNPATGQSFKVGGITGVSGANGDMAFTASGALVLVADNNVYSVNGTIPTTAGNATLTTTLITSLPSGTNGNGVAFGNGGYLYISTSTQLIRLNPTNPADTRTTVLSSGSGHTDMGSCAFPNTLTVQKNLGTPRVNTGDQFTVSIGNGHYATPTAVSATTSGTNAGIQTQQAGPVFINQQVAYRISEAAAGTTNLDMYGKSMACTEYVAGVPVTTSGSAPAWNATSSANLQGVDIICVITNRALEPDIDLVKTISNTGSGTGGAFVAGDVVNYQFVVTNTGELPLTGVTVADPLAGLSAISYGTWPTATTGRLEPNQSVTATATLTVTQAHINSGAINNTATATELHPPARRSPIKTMRPSRSIRIRTSV